MTLRQGQQFLGFVFSCKGAFSFLDVHFFAFVIYSYYVHVRVSVVAHF